MAPGSAMAASTQVLMAMSRLVAATFSLSPSVRTKTLVVIGSGLLVATARPATRRAWLSCSCPAVTFTRSSSLWATGAAQAPPYVYSRRTLEDPWRLVVGDAELYGNAHQVSTAPDPQPRLERADNLDSRFCAPVRHRRSPRSSPLRLWRVPSPAARAHHCRPRSAARSRCLGAGRRNPERRPSRVCGARAGPLR